MKYFLLLIAFLPTFGLAQANLFDVEVIETNYTAKDNPFNKLEHYTDYLFEDEQYIVTSECAGEFGGKINFKDKKTGAVNSGYACCAIIINKLDNKYYLTTSLQHMTGSCGFYEIDDPKELKVNINDTVYNSDRELMCGLKPLVANYGKIIMLSFPYKSKIYHIINDHHINETYIAVRENAEFKKIQTLNNWNVYVFSEQNTVTKSGHYAVKFGTKENDRYRMGYIDVFENKIKFYFCQ